MKHLSYLIAALLLLTASFLFFYTEDETDSAETSSPETKSKSPPSSSSSKAPSQFLKQTSQSNEESEIDKSFKVQERPPKSPKPKRPKYPFAETVPGKPGYVINPVTGNEVDVRGIPEGILVTDPEDPDKNKFRIPLSE